MKRTKEYYDYMKSDAWNKRRKERLHLDDYTCQDCGATDKPLDVHHLSYIHFGNESMDDLLSICRKCHDIRHGKEVTIFTSCFTCGEFLPVSVQKIKMLGEDTLKMVCSKGHIRLYGVLNPIYDYIRKLL